MFQLQVEHGHASNHICLSSEEQSVCRSQSALRDHFLPDSLISPNILESRFKSESDANAGPGLVFELASCRYPSSDSNEMKSTPPRVL